MSGPDHPRAGGASADGGTPQPRDAGVALRSAAGRGVLLTTVLGSGMAFLDGTVVNVALPAIGGVFGSSMSGLQWTIDAYLLTLSAFLLVGGSLGDALGRRRIFALGAIAFAGTSILCGFAPSIERLCLSRALQGIAAALLVPGSLAILRSSIRPEDEDAAIGTWAGLSGVTTAAGPLVGGWLVQAWSWRAIFFLNVPIAAAVVWGALRSVPASPGARRRRLDVVGAALAALGLAGTVHALIEGPAHAWRWPSWALGPAGVLALGAFLAWERRARSPMLPLSLFCNRQFAAANAVTLAVYFALSAATFLVVFELQRGLGYTPLASGVALLPITVVTLVLSPLVGKATPRIGYRAPMTLGPLCAGAGLTLLAHAGSATQGPLAFVAGMGVLAVGLAITVPPLTSAVMTGAGEGDAGVASGVNNAVARVAGLLGVAVLPAVAGVSAGDAAGGPTGAPLLHAVRTALLVAAVVCAAGGAIAWLGLPRRERPAVGHPAVGRCW